LPANKGRQIQPALSTGYWEISAKCRRHLAEISQKIAKKFNDEPLDSSVEQYKIWKEKLKIW
jgi:hypothetical protein